MRSISGLINMSILAILLITGEVSVAAVLMSLWVVIEYLWVLMNPCKYKDENINRIYFLYYHDNEYYDYDGIVLPNLFRKQWVSYMLMDIQFANQSVSSDVIVTCMLIVMMTASSIMNTSSSSAAATATTANDGSKDDGDNDDDKEKEKEIEPAWMKRVSQNIMMN